jgi:Dyp-type peroxidase family
MKRGDTGAEITRATPTRGGGEPVRLELGDIQGLVVTSYSHLPCAAYRLLRITEAAGARRWLSQLIGYLTTAAVKDQERSVNVAFTSDGLHELGLTRGKGTFPTAFEEGMASARRARILGDIGDNAAERWDWGSPAKEPVHVLLLAYARDEDRLHLELDAHKDGEGMRTVATFFAGRQPDTREHFGFNDGIGQPVIEGTGNEKRQRARTGHATIVPPGDFILGYRNAYGPPAAGATIPVGAGFPFGRNGTYLVFRQLAQDVSGFWKYVRDHGRAAWPDDPHADIRAAAKAVGRWPSGASLVRHPGHDPHQGTDRTTNENRFQFAEDDPRGAKCPLGSHVRRCNPRDSLGDDPARALTSANRHRLLRRGRSYGDRIKEPWTMADAPPDGKERGLHFICLNADLERQFEFVQQTWINNPVFAGLPLEVDPLVGAHPLASSMFTVQAEPLRVRLHGLAPFVTVRGGAYFFMPGIAAVKFLATS